MRSNDESEEGSCCNIYVHIVVLIRYWIICLFLFLLIRWNYLRSKQEDNIKLSKNIICLSTFRHVIRWQELVVLTTLNPPVSTIETCYTSTKKKNRPKFIFSFSVLFERVVLSLWRTTYSKLLTVTCTNALIFEQAKMCKRSY